jgi:F-type H+/Na+-transporting ATPase subunit alpha
VQSGQLSDDTIETLKSAIADFKKQFETSTGDPIGEKEHPAKPMGEGEEGQETVQVKKKKPKPAEQQQS